MKKLLIKEISRGNISDTVEHVLLDVTCVKEGLCSETLKYNIKLALWEVMTNLVSHGDEAACRNIEIEIHEDQLTVEIQVVSSGNHFDWEKYRDSECPSKEQFGGRGIFILQQICDDFSYQQMGRIARMLFVK